MANAQEVLAYHLARCHILYKERQQHGEAIESIKTNLREELGDNRSMGILAAADRQALRLIDKTVEDL